MPAAVCIIAPPSAVVHQVPHRGVHLVHGLAPGPVQGLPGVMLLVTEPGDFRYRCDGIGEIHQHTIENRQTLAGVVVGWKTHLTFLYLMA